MNGTDEFVGFMKQVSSVWPSGIDISIKIGPQATYTAAPPVVAPPSPPDPSMGDPNVECRALRAAFDASIVKVSELLDQAGEDAGLIREQDDAIKAATNRIVFLQKQIFELTNKGFQHPGNMPHGELVAEAVKLGNLHATDLVRIRELENLALRRREACDMALKELAEAKESVIRLNLENNRLTGDYRHLLMIHESMKSSAKGALAMALDGCFCDNGGKPECQRCVQIRSVWEKL